MLDGDPVLWWRVAGSLASKPAAPGVSAHVAGKFPRALQRFGGSDVERQVSQRGERPGRQALKKLPQCLAPARGGGPVVVCQRSRPSSTWRGGAGRGS